MPRCAATPPAAAAPTASPPPEPGSPAPRRSRSRSPGQARPRPATPDGPTLERAILDLLHARRPGSSCCPSEIPRRLLGERGPWRPLMQATRDAAARLAARGEVWVTQRGVRVDPGTARGPIRLRLAEKGG